MGTEDMLPEGEKLRKAVKWLSEMVREYPEKRPIPRWQNPL